MQETAVGPYISALPVTVVDRPATRLPPRLAYSTNAGSQPLPAHAPRRQKVPTRKSSCYAAYTNAELRMFAASCQRYRHNLVGVPKSGHQKAIAIGTRESEKKRALHLDERFRALQKQAKAAPLQDMKLLLGIILTLVAVQFVDIYGATLNSNVPSQGDKKK